jgi:O-antigen/teichoic acid export membrane protein
VPFYTVPTTLLGLFFTPINSWHASMQSAYGEAWTARDLGWIRQAFRRTIDRALLLGGLGLSVFIAVGASFIATWTHGRLTLSPAMTASVCAIAMSGALVTAGEFLLTGLNRHRSASVAELACGLLSLVLVPYSVATLGLGAVGVGAIASVLVTSAWVLRREIAGHLGGHCFPPLSYSARLSVAVAAAAWAGMLASGAVPSAAGTGQFLRLAAGSVAAFAVYAAAAAVLRLVAVEEAFRLKRQLMDFLVPSASGGSA